MRVKKHKGLRGTACLLVIVLVVSLLSGCTSGSTVEQTGDTDKYPRMKLRMTTNGTAIATDTVSAQRFAEIVAEQSGNNIQISVFSDDQLAGGNMSKGVEMVAQGATEISAYATSVLAAIDQRLMVGALPWLFADYTEAREVIDTTGGPFYAKLLKEKGLHYLASTHNGFRQITNNERTIRTPEDIFGLKIRIPGGQIYREFWQAFKADPVAMSWGEVYTALQQGTLDGQENGYSVTNSANVFEIQKYMTEWNYTYEQYLFVVNQRVWDGLTPETQTLLQEAATEAANWGRDKVEKEELELRQKFMDSGMDVYIPTEEEMAAFKAVVQPMIARYAEIYGEEADRAFNLTGLE